MRFILDPRCSLRGWKNRPFNISMDQSPLPPVRISEELCARLGRSIEYSGNDPETEQLIGKGILRPCTDDAVLTEGQGYRNYGCLHFDSVIFSITGKCNYNCMHCSVNAPASPMGELSMERICELLDEMKECGLKNIVLIGGEPLIRRDFLQIVDEIAKRGMFVVQIFTNGSLISCGLLDGLRERGLSPLFMISFDGVGFHDAMRGVKGAEEVFYKKLGLLREYGFRISCNMCVTRESITSLWTTINVLSERGVSSLTVYPPASCGLWKAKAGTLGASSELVADVYEAVIEEYTAANYPIDLNLYGLAYFDSRSRKYIIAPKWRSRSGDALAPACRTFEQELNISPEGTLSPCYAMMSESFVRENMPNLNKMPLKQALTDSAFTRLMELKLSDILGHNPRCRECGFASFCGGGCRMQAFEENGDFMGIDPRSCEFFRSGAADRFRAAARRGAARRVAAEHSQ